MGGVDDGDNAFDDEEELSLDESAEPDNGWSSSEAEEHLHSASIYTVDSGARLGRGDGLRLANPSPGSIDSSTEA